jgi:hypothetical protein
MFFRFGLDLDLDLDLDKKICCKRYKSPLDMLASVALVAAFHLAALSLVFWTFGLPRTRGALLGLLRDAGVAAGRALGEKTPGAAAGVVRTEVRNILDDVQRRDPWSVSATAPAEACAALNIAVVAACLVLAGVAAAARGVGSVAAAWVLACVAVPVFALGCASKLLLFSLALRYTQDSRPLQRRIAGRLLHQVKANCLEDRAAPPSCASE